VALVMAGGSALLASGVIPSASASSPPTPGDEWAAAGFFLVMAAGFAVAAVIAARRQLREHPPPAPQPTQAGLRLEPASTSAIEDRHAAFLTSITPRLDNLAPVLVSEHGRGFWTVLDHPPMGRAGVPVPVGWPPNQTRLLLTVVPRGS
jgi:hypothetical protein